VRKPIVEVSFGLSTPICAISGFEIEGTSDYGVTSCKFNAMLAHGVQKDVEPPTHHHEEIHRFH
jgi:hypothetical protein